MSEITVRSMATKGLDPTIAATLIAKSGSVDLQEIVTIMDLRRQEHYLCGQHGFHVTIATEPNGGPLGVAIMTPVVVFEGCCHFTEVRLDLYVPGREVAVYKALIEAAVTRGRNEGASHTYIPLPSPAVKEIVGDSRLLTGETLVLP